MKPVQMRKIFQAILVFMHTIAIAQSKTIQPSLLYSNGDTSFFYKVTSAQASKLRLQHLVTAQESIHFRFWTESQVVDVWSQNNKVFYGQLISFTTKVRLSRKKEQFYKKVLPLDRATAKKLYNLFDTMNIFAIPNSDSIKEWQTGLDGITYQIELSTPSLYSYKTYWTPKAQVNMKEAVLIDLLATSLSESLGMPEAWKKFIESLPYGCYHQGGGRSVCTFPKNNTN
jgi:hypothetical protein